MYKKVLEHSIIKTIGEYTITKSIEQMYFDNCVKLGNKQTWYDVCLNNEDGDIVFSCNKLSAAEEWIGEN